VVGESVTLAVGRKPSGDVTLDVLTKRRTRGQLDRTGYQPHFAAGPRPRPRLALTAAKHSNRPGCGRTSADALGV
jgi:hypothetical protein